jgi:predicted metalloprotease
MRWQDLRRSDNVEDRRGISGRSLALGGGGIGTLIIIILYALLGGDPRQLAQQLPQQSGAPSGQVADPSKLSPEDRQMGEFVRAVLGDTEDVWRKVFNDMGRAYREPRLVMFTGRVDSGCGFASAAVGPFYCPEDEKVYIDLSFYRELKQRFHAPGDFAQAYVIAHEVGHHVQKILGTSDKVHAMQSRASKSEANELSVRLELQADFYAGVWAHYAQKYQNILEPGDVEEALNAASQIGDDKIQMQAQGYVVPDSFTHGSSAQRVKWFRKGFETGDMSQGDTFSANDL